MKLAQEAFSSSVAKAMGDRSKMPYFGASDEANAFIPIASNNLHFKKPFQFLNQVRRK